MSGFHAWSLLAALGLGSRFSRTFVPAVEMKRRRNGEQHKEASGSFIHLAEDGRFVATLSPTGDQGRNDILRVQFGSNPALETENNILIINCMAGTREMELHNRISPQFPCNHALASPPRTFVAFLAHGRP